MASKSGSSPQQGGGPSVSAAVSQVTAAVSALTSLGVSAEIVLRGSDSRLVSVLSELGPRLKSVRVSLRGTTPVSS